MLEVIRQLHTAHPRVRFRVPLYKAAFRELCEEVMYTEDEQLPIDFFVGRTPEIVEAADCCLMVSGSVSLEMLARRTPAVVVYRPPLSMAILFWPLITCKYMSLPNLMTGREIMPEHVIIGNPDRHVEAMVETLNLWLRSPRVLAERRQELDDLASRAAEPGGIARAASIIVQEGAVAVASVGCLIGRHPPDRPVWWYTFCSPERRMLRLR